MRIVLIACAGLVSSWTSAAVAQTFEDLEGKSIVYAYHERNSYRSGNLADIMWNGRIYVAPDGRVFLRHHSAAHFGYRSSEFTQLGFDSEGDRDGNGNGRRTNFHWSGNGFARSWDDDGVQTTEIVSIQDSRCQAFVRRDPFTGTMLHHSGSCRIVPGNAIDH